ncbi:anion exchanging protein [Hysterangium stoloniferum]|nr:anion exchanging protein [Hysterangium stoloniferum]
MHDEQLSVRRRRIRRYLLNIRPFHGIIRDIKARVPYYTSDWTDAYNYRVVPATALTFFSNVFPGIAFSLDLIETTQQYGVAEVLLSSFMAAAVFSIFGAQPLCIAGVTGPITVLNKTIFDVVANHPNGPNYLQFVGWVYLWGAILHWITAALNWCNLLKYVTIFSCDTFGFFVSWVYIQYGIQVLTRQFHTSPLPSAYVSIILAFVMLSLSVCFRVLAQSNFFHRHVRRVFADYGMPISIVATSALAYWGRFNDSNPATLPVLGAFEAAGRREWLVRFWELDGKWVAIAFPFGLALWVLFFFDHNVSSLMAQGSNFPLRKPPGFHYDFFLLGITTLIAGVIGVPAPNGLIPQAPIHTQSLVVLGQCARSSKSFSKEESAPNPFQNETINSAPISTSHPATEDAHDIQPQHRTIEVAQTYRTNAGVPDVLEEEGYHGPLTEVPIAVVEQRLSNLAQGALCLVLLTGPFLHVLGLIPRGVLAGLFWYMGLDALSANGITRRILYLSRDKSLMDQEEPLRCVRKSRIVLFTVIELIAFGATMTIVQTISAIGFPVIIMLLVPIRILLVPKLPFSPEELAILDGPTASPFTMASVGGSV